MKLRIMLSLIFVLGSVCMMAFADTPPLAPQKAKPVMVQASAYQQLAMEAIAPYILEKRSHYKIDSAAHSARGQTKLKPEVKSPLSKAVRLHNKDEPVLRE